jgi:hypothetical protein
MFEEPAKSNSSLDDHVDYCALKRHRQCRTLRSGRLVALCRPRLVGVKTQSLRLVLEHRRNSMTLLKWCSSRPSQIHSAETIRVMVSDGRITTDI